MEVSRCMWELCTRRGDQGWDKGRNLLPSQSRESSGKLNTIGEMIKMPITYKAGSGRNASVLKVENLGVAGSTQETILITYLNLSSSTGIPELQSRGFLNRDGCNLVLNSLNHSLRDQEKERVRSGAVTFRQTITAKILSSFYF